MYFNTINASFTADTDYGILDEFLRMFEVGSVNGDEDCIDISILNNLAFEKTESLSVHIVAVEATVRIHIAYLTIVIHDDDGKHFTVHAYGFACIDNEKLGNHGLLSSYKSPVDLRFALLYGASVVVAIITV